MEFEKLCELIGEVLDMDPSSITAESSFVEDLGADSLDRMEIVMQIEDHLEIEIPNEVIENIVTVGDAMNMIESIK